MSHSHIHTRPFSYIWLLFIWSLIPPPCTEKNNQTNLRCVSGNKNVSQTKFKKRKTARDDNSKWLILTTQQTQRFSEVLNRDFIAPNETRWTTSPASNEMTMWKHNGEFSLLILLAWYAYIVPAQMLWQCKTCRTHHDNSQTWSLRKG